MPRNFNLRPNRRPNIIWIFGDQHRAQALSYRGDLNVYTPNIDNLARNGVRFDNAVAGAPWCTPFRGALLSGTYPHQNGAIRTPSPLWSEIPTIAIPFNQVGYHTAYFGKWHLDGSNSRQHFIPPERRGGFQYWMGYENNNNQQECYVHGSEGDDPVRLAGYETDALTDLLIQHLQDHLNFSTDAVGQSAPNGYSDGLDQLDYQPFFCGFVGSTSARSLRFTHQPGSWLPTDSSS